jgi:hypothetical protein
LLTIRLKQIRVFDETLYTDLVRRLTATLRQTWPDRVPAADEELKQSIEGWIADARCCGLYSYGHIERYVRSRAQLEGKRAPLNERLAVYLRMNHDDLLAGVDAAKFVQRVIHFAARHNVHAEEGVTWLALILLAGHKRSGKDYGWINELLDHPNLSEEERVHRVHLSAVQRGWISAAKDA